MHRLCPHTSFDDERRYREAAELAEGRDREPLGRYRRFLERQGLWDHAWADRLERQLREQVEAETVRAERSPVADPDTVLDHVFHGAEVAQPAGQAG